MDRNVSTVVPTSGLRLMPAVTNYFASQTPLAVHVMLASAGFHAVSVSGVFHFTRY